MVPHPSFNEDQDGSINALRMNLDQKVARANQARPDVSTPIQGKITQRQNMNAQLEAQ